jgi:hypothetical protein
LKLKRIKSGDQKVTKKNNSENQTTMAADSMGIQSNETTESNSNSEEHKTEKISKSRQEDLSQFGEELSKK